ncbi:hypothetical protein DM02DRAFT_616039 [Periconia macrospinosa]|uniref:Uncharacterized protein n=1 Tax=Periconia macrospinosa TaxID=97972 RepID=A0A2V1DLT3_9PLEO|nr:hypothetical protein DM02DRAFT_616039 [Periconia macrospinosa]
MFSLPLMPMRRKSDSARTVDTTFTFGQRGCHFFQCASRRDYSRLPAKLTTLLTSAQLQKVHHVTLGYEQSFLLTWRDSRGYDHIDFQDLPDELTTFLLATSPQGTLLRSIPNIRLTLGPYSTSFYVTDAASYLWMNLPPLLLTALQDRIRNGTWLDKPRLVCLGADANFLLLTEKHAAVWDLSNYAVLGRMIEYSRTQERGIEEVKNVAMHAYRYQCFVAESWVGVLLYDCVPPHEVAGVEAMRAAVLREAQERSRSDEEARRKKDVRVKEEESRRRREEMQRRPEVRPESRQQSSGSRDWGERRQEFIARSKGKGLKLSLSFKISGRGVSGGFGLL